MNIAPDPKIGPTEATTENHCKQCTKAIPQGETICRSCGDKKKSRIAWIGTAAAAAATFAVRFKTQIGAAIHRGGKIVAITKNFIR
ncbi:hypothetical protein [Actinomyces ruminis]|uniref:hypothetical protein n=1 Tax=Actinomyces ruminis TaxID=1937003 RepID=UPI001178CB2F|nr:hypothetical protein [Actinomyces ruminis]